MWALVTGASSGIGKEIALELSTRGYDLVLVSRNRLALKKVRDQLGTNAVVIARDLTNEKAPEQVFRELIKRGIILDVLVNDAGIGEFGKFVDTDLGKEKLIIKLNILALTSMTKLALRQMVPRRRGMILNLASIASFQPGPLMAVYYASKSYVLSFSHAIAEELEGTGITVTALCPGYTKTDFENKAHMKASRMVRRNKPLDAGEVARTGVKAMLQGRREVVVGAAYKFIAFSNRLMPRRTQTKVVREMQRPIAKA